METLGKLFGGINKVKVLRLFVLNQDDFFEMKQITKLCRLSPQSARKELILLEGIGFVKPKLAAKVKTWGINPFFPFIGQLKIMLSQDMFESKDGILKNFKNCGRIRLFIVAGMFINDPDSRIDIFIVGDSLKKGAIEKAIHKIESEIGKELRYSILETSEFNFRFYSGDRFVRDILDFPHERLLDKITQLSTPGKN